MGNSVGVSSSASFTSSHAEFSRLEKMCSNYYFFDHFTEYEQAVLRAIDNNAIDALEVLLPAGNSKRLLPLHMSCRAGRLEPTELLLSAGFNCYMQDGDGRLPLHLCSMVTSFESSLCATLILLNSAKSISAIDHEGNTPIHTAVLHNNIHVLEAFMRNKVNININNSKGKTPYQLAKERNHTDILRLFANSSSSPVVDEKDDRQHRRSRSGRGEQKRKGKRGGDERDRRDVRRSRSLDSSQVDYDRIMQVWERFFENAALSKAGIPLDDDDSLLNDVDDDDDVNYCKPSSPNKTSSKAWGRCDDKHASWEAPRAKSQSASSDPKPYPHSTRGGLDSLFVDTKMSIPSSSLAYSNNSRISNSSSKLSHEDIDISTRRPPSPERMRSVNDDLIRAVGWFDWIVCYDFAKYEESSSYRDHHHHPYQEEEGEDFCSAERCYYVVHMASKQCRWLHDHVELFQTHVCSHSLLKSIGNDWHDYELHMQYSLPITLLELVLRGWLTYYDSCENLCKWINIPTKSFELTLPLGIGEHSLVLEQLNFSPSASDQLWYLPDQSCAYMWVVVIYNCSSTMEDVVTVTNAFSDDDNMEGCNASSLDNSFYNKKASMSSSCTITASEHKDRSTDEHTNVKATTSSSSVWEQQQYQSMDGDVPAYGIYYRNRITGESSWNAPVGWDYLVASWDDWTLCCNEESYDELYWHDFNSGESVWA